MARFQFSLRQLLVAIVVVAVALLLVRFAIQSHGVAVALLVVAIGAIVLLVANVAVYAFLRGFGLVFGLDLQPVEDSQPASVTTPAEPESRRLEVEI